MSDPPIGAVARPDGKRLADVLSEFARTMVTDFPIQEILNNLVVRIVDILPVSAAGVSLISPALNPRHLVASDEFGLQCEQLQSELGEGPCLLAYDSGVAVAVPNLASEKRFPAFAACGLAAGLSAVFSFPLRHGDHRFGALDLYVDTPAVLSDEAMADAQTLADVAAAYLLNAQAREALRVASEQSRVAALHDALTGLPNRTLLLERIEHALLGIPRSGNGLAIFFVDLDRFKAINDAFGHRVGDELLVAVGRRMTELLRPHDTVARLSGDEFVILCEDLESVVQAHAIGARLDAGLKRPFTLSSQELVLTGSVGVAFAATGDQTAEKLIHDADMAMYDTKREIRHPRTTFAGLDLSFAEPGARADRGGLVAQREPHSAGLPPVGNSDGRTGANSDGRTGASRPSSPGIA